MSRHLRAPKLGNSDGISLLEIILAVSIVVVSLSALVTIANTASRNVAASRGHTIADQHVRAGTEQLRHIRDNQGWSGLLGVGTSYELAPGSTRYYSLDNSGTLTYRAAVMATDICGVPAVKTSTYQIDATHYRVVKMSLNNAGGEAAITVTVCYDYRGTTYKNSSATTILTNWR